MSEQKTPLIIANIHLGFGGMDILGYLREDGSVLAMTGGRLEVFPSVLAWHKDWIDHN